ncbi:hypothetical protein TNCV_3330771 [Trichonephila clavipes]|nr:hypothetical protein TNCV_3330771 [Trichonephila clavipes]
MMFDYRNSSEKWKTPRESWRMPLVPPFARVVEPSRKPSLSYHTIVERKRNLQADHMSLIDDSRRGKPPITDDVAKEDNYILLDQILMKETS